MEIITLVIGFAIGYFLGMNHDLVKQFIERFKFRQDENKKRS